MQKIVKYSDSVFQGDTWDGVLVGVTIDEEPLDLSATDVRLTWREGSPEGLVHYVMTTPEQITVTSENKYQILPIKVDFPLGQYVGDFTITKGDVVKTYLRIYLTVEPTTNGMQ